MTKYLSDEPFSTTAPPGQTYRDNWDAIFSKKEPVEGVVEQPTKSGRWKLTPSLVRVVPVGHAPHEGASFNPPYPLPPKQEDMPLLAIPEEQREKTALLVGRVLVAVTRIYENTGTKPTLALVNPHDTKGTPFEKNGTEGVVSGVQIVTSMLCPYGQVMLNVES